MAQIGEVLTRLIQRTGEGGVPWQPTSDEQTFIVAYGNLSALIQIDSFGDTVLKIMNVGNEIERLDSGVEVEDDISAQLTTLHQMARRDALGVDKQLDEFLDKIGSSIDDLPF